MIGCVAKAESQQVKVDLDEMDEVCALRGRRSPCDP